MADTRTPPEQLQNALAGRYRIERELGAGGMATVYLAEDVRHRRRVAVKVLHPELSAVVGTDRFLKEIELTAGLQHPHILPLFDSGAAEGQLYYVMPYVSGETLRTRLERERQLPIADAVRIAGEVADALQYAHARSVVHRDIKPENILLQDGHALVADFGIALAVENAGGQRMTQTGLSLGTPQYMAPEQAMGERSVDARADIYALGTVTYEMITGEPPFTGPTAQAIVAKVLTEDPRPLTAQRRSVPEHVEAAVLTALEKLPADRPPTADAFRSAISGAAVLPRRSRSRADVSRVADHRWRMLAIAAGVIAIIATGIAAATRLSRPAGSARVIRFSVPLPPRALSSGARISIMRDGSAMAFVDRAPAPRGGIYIRRIDASDARLVPGTAGARMSVFSPDGASIAFTTSDGQLRAIPRDGGTPVTLASGVDAFEGLAWHTDGHIYVVARDSGVVSRVPAQGGAMEHLGTLDTAGSAFGFRNHGGPYVLRNGRAVLFAIDRGPGREPDIGAVDLRSRTTRMLAKGGHVLGVHAGHLLYVAADGSIRAYRFDEANLRISDAPITLLPGVIISEAQAEIALSDEGTLVYEPALSSQSQLVWVTRDGTETSVDPSLQRSFDAVAVSPRGDRLALSTDEGDGSTSVWLYDLRLQTIIPFARSTGTTHRPKWTPDGSRIVYVSDRGDAEGIRSLWIHSVDGSDTGSVLVRSPRHAQEVAWTPDQSWIVFRDGYDDGTTLRDIRYTRPHPDSAKYPFATTNANEYAPALSADGTLLAWVSNESGREEVYVAAFPSRRGRIVVSQNGGTQPVWSRRGRELFYRAIDGRVVSVTFASGAGVEISARAPLFNAAQYLSSGTYSPYDVAPDGRFVFVKQPEGSGAQVVINWFAEIAPRLRRR